MNKDLEIIAFFQFKFYTKYEVFWKRLFSYACSQCIDSYSKTEMLKKCDLALSFLQQFKVYESIYR